MMNKKGFTLLELLVVTAILAVLIGISTTVFISILRSQNKTNVINEVRQNATLAIDLFERDVRSASDIIPDGGSFLTNKITLVEVENGTAVDWECVDAVGIDNGYIQRTVDDGSGVDQVITNTDTKTGVSVDCGGDGATEAFVVSDSATPIVTMRFDALQGEEAPGRADYRVTLPFETTVGVRDFN